MNIGDYAVTIFNKFLFFNKIGERFYLVPILHLYKTKVGKQMGEKRKIENYSKKTSGNHTVRTKTTLKLWSVRNCNLLLNLFKRIDLSVNIFRDIRWNNCKLRNP